MCVKDSLANEAFLGYLSVNQWFVVWQLDHVTQTITVVSESFRELV